MEFCVDKTLQWPQCLTEIVENLEIDTLHPRETGWIVIIEILEFMYTWRIERFTEVPSVNLNHGCGLNDNDL